jgi:4-hydroxybenzoate polyprenyltransferase
MSLLRRIATYGRLVRFSHTVFALPFAVMGAVLGLRAGGTLGAWEGLWILVAMVAARTAAMTMNRLADHRIDAANPRTANRELPSGILDRPEVWGVLVVSVGAFVLACGMLNRMTLVLSPVVLVVVLGYPYTKRFTSLCHVWLGAALGLSPVGAWVAVVGGFGDGFTAALWLGIAVVLWTAGFDILYALLDVEYDREAGLHSLPVRLGVLPALVLSAVFHVGTVTLLVLAGRVAGLGWVYGIGTGIVALILIAEHAVVKPGDLSRLNLAFFTMNGAVSLVLMASLIVDVLV